MYKNLNTYNFSSPSNLSYSLARLSLCDFMLFISWIAALSWCSLNLSPDTFRVKSLEIFGQDLGNLWTRPWTLEIYGHDLGPWKTQVTFLAASASFLAFSSSAFISAEKIEGLWQRQDSGIKWHYQMQGMLKWAMSMRSGFCFYQHHQSQRYLQCHHPRKMQLITIIIYL